MKKNFLVTTLLVFSSTAFATPFNGYIVKMKNANGFLSDKSLEKFGTVSKIAKTSFGNFARIETHPGLTDSSLKKLASNPNVEYIEPNYIITINKNVTSPNDSAFKKQWGLNNSSKKSEDVNALKAWDVTKGSTQVKVAVIDTGVDYTHPDLKSQIDINTAEQNGKAGVDDDGNGLIDDVYGYNFSSKTADPMDGHGHGTHCAGVIGAAHNGSGIVGVMANVKIIPIKFLSDEGSGETIDAISAIDYAIKRGANVMSNSWGGGDREQSLEDAIKGAEAAGITFVAAAGNEYSNNDNTSSFPANYEVSNVISVGSFASSGAKSSFSNYGIKSVHVFAPGSNIYSTVNRGGYQSMSGTSMATPHVAGIVGLMLSKEPNLTPKEIRERLIRTSNQTSSLKGLSQSNGRVDAYRALMNQ
jgi:subtilisin family serine protease